MPTVKRRSHDMPGTDPTFHQYRRYLSPIRYKGQEILASFGSCKHPGCNYSAAWLSNAGREVGMWKHRSEKVRDARISYFMRKFKVGPEKAQELFLAYSDRHSHTYENWVGLVEGYVRVIAGLGIDDEALPSISYEAKYHLGVGAKDMAKQILDEGYEI